MPQRHAPLQMQSTYLITYILIFADMVRLVSVNNITLWKRTEFLSVMIWRHVTDLRWDYTLRQLYRSIKIDENISSVFVASDHVPKATVLHE